ncbi:hypothetical protein HOG17_04720 [Candidatus Peregrinibacteria bacterium]|jgi:hypothetical protein|nr:hypothetical protein [Candidatus Peregrinibacteria bacterium]MBT4147869.1 hypothetical protein [Candidatus Peregrinibacteria bacterium]MBT4366076.1 hypothetical protein [Candidatus Peregrinibacteria bacterium]MBT4455857.1 hypothetical protein [Candidatus Peregrinibacteria bacterium]
MNGINGGKDYVEGPGLEIPVVPIKHEPIEGSPTADEEVITKATKEKVTTELLSRPLTQEEVDELCETRLGQIELYKRTIAFIGKTDPNQLKRMVFAFRDTSILDAIRDGFHIALHGEICKNTTLKLIDLAKIQKACLKEKPFLVPKFDDCELPNIQRFVFAIGIPLRAMCFYYNDPAIRYHLAISPEDKMTDTELFEFLGQHYGTPFLKEPAKEDADEEVYLTAGHVEVEEFKDENGDTKRKGIITTGTEDFGTCHKTILDHCGPQLREALKLDAIEIKYR